MHTLVTEPPRATVTKLRPQVPGRETEAARLFRIARDGVQIAIQKRWQDEDDAYTAELAKEGKRPINAHCPRCGNRHWQEVTVDAAAADNDELLCDRCEWMVREVDESWSGTRPERPYRMVRLICEQCADVVEQVVEADSDLTNADLTLCPHCEQRPAEFKLPTVPTL